MLTLPKDSGQFKWTRHIKNKMVYYHLSQATIVGIFRKPTRKEEGIAPRTIAAMKPKPRRQLGRGSDLATRPDQSVGTRASEKHEEIWIMYQTKKSKVTMISAWRYPGTTKPGERPSIPADILEELGNL